MNEAASHYARSDERLEAAIKAFENPRAIALSCFGKDRHQIHLHLLDCANVVAEQQGFPKDGNYAQARALRYASEAVEWLWQNAKVVDVGD